MRRKSMQPGAGETGEHAQQRALFREQALQYYRRGQEQIVLPGFISPPTMAILWCLIALVCISGTIAWFWRVPIYVTATGEISAGQTGQHNTLVVLVLPTSQGHTVRLGAAVLLQVGQNGPQWQQKISSIEAPASPAEIRARFHLDATLSLLVSQPCAVALVVVPPSPGYAGSIVQARIQIGTQRFISLLPTFATLGEG
jgi:hypothetical protein